MTLRMTLADLKDVETRVTDEATGGQKGVKLTQVGALDPVALMAVARVAGFGANKYAAFNYLKGYDWAHSFNAMQRHAMLFWAGEDIDQESGQPHMAMAAWHAMALVSFAARGIGTDTRPPKLEPVEYLSDGWLHPGDPDYPYDEVLPNADFAQQVIDQVNQELERSLIRAENFDRLAEAAGVLSHGEPGAYECNIPGCEVQGHKPEPARDPHEDDLPCGPDCGVEPVDWREPDDL